MRCQRISFASAEIVPGMPACFSISFLSVRALSVKKPNGFKVQVLVLQPNKLRNNPGVDHLPDDAMLPAVAQRPGYAEQVRLRLRPAAEPTLSGVEDFLRQLHLPRHCDTLLSSGKRFRRRTRPVNHQAHRGVFYSASCRIFYGNT